MPENTSNRPKWGYTDASGQKVTALRDMFDGGGAGRSGDTFQGGGSISALANALGIRPMGYRERMAARQAAPAGGGNRRVTAPTSVPVPVTRTTSFLNRVNPDAFDPRTGNYYNQAAASPVGRPVNPAQPTPPADLAIAALTNLGLGNIETTVPVPETAKTRLQPDVGFQPFDVTAPAPTAASGSATPEEAEFYFRYLVEKGSTPQQAADWIQNTYGVPASAYMNTPAAGGILNVGNEPMGGGGVTTRTNPFWARQANAYNIMRNVGLTPSEAAYDFRSAGMPLPGGR